MSMEIISDVLLGTIVAGSVLAVILAILIWIKDLTRRISYLRIFIQIVSVAAISSYLLVLALWPSIVVGFIFVLTIFFGRFFCGWIRPLGLYMDLITQIRKVFKIGYWNLSEKVNRSLHKLRYAFVAAILTLPFFFGPLNPEVWGSFAFFGGPFTLLIIVFLGPLEPLIHQLGGPVQFDGWYLSYPYIRGIMDYSSGIFIPINVFVFIAFTVVTAFMVRRFWCRFCPTAVSIAALNRFAPFKWVPLLRINKVEEKCTKCGICKRVCPLQVTEVYEQKGGDVTTSMCMLCFRCVEMCPYEDCLKVNVSGKSVFNSRNWLERAK